MIPPRRSLVFALAIAVSLGTFQLGRAMAPQPVQAAPPAAAPERPEHPLARRLRERYGPKKNSSDYEEWIIRDFFQDKRNGVFLDVGANHYRDENNTYFLETELGLESRAWFPRGSRCWITSPLADMRSSAGICAPTSRTSTYSRFARTSRDAGAPKRELCTRCPCR